MPTYFFHHTRTTQSFSRVIETSFILFFSGMLVFALQASNNAQERIAISPPDDKLAASES